MILITFLSNSFPSIFLPFRSETIKLKVVYKSILTKLITNSFNYFLYFLFLGILSFVILASDITLTSIMQIIAILILLIIISAKFILPKLPKSKPVAYLLGLSPVILLIYLLVFSTGGLSSPFLILTHYFAIGLAFLISPQIAVTFIAVTISLVITNLAQDQSAKEFLVKTPFVSFLYFVSYIALVPFSYILAKEYKFKEEWGKILEKQIATSKTQEEELLKNITDAVFVLNPQFDIVYQNLPSTKLSGYQKEILGQDFFKYFSFKDKEGRTLEPYSIPFEQTLSSKTQSILQNVQIQGKEKKYIHVDIKILPIIQAEGPVGLILIVKDRSAKELEAKKSEDTSSMALVRFITFLNKQREALSTLKKTAPEKNIIAGLISQNEELEHLSQDFIYTLRLEAGEIGALSIFFDIGELTEELIGKEKGHAQELGITLNPKTTLKTTPQIQPKTELSIPTEKRIFPPVYIIGNIPWIQDSLRRILEIALRLCQKNQEVLVEVTRDQELAKIRIHCPSNKISESEAPDLFEKFYGRLRNLPEFSPSSGLEGYIAKSLIDRMGGNASVEVKKDPPTLIFQVTFGTKPLA